MSEMPESPISPQLTLLIHLHQYYLEAINVGFNETQALTLTMKLQELSTMTGLINGMIDGQSDE